MMHKCKWHMLHVPGGVVSQLAEFRADHLQQTSVGRVAHNALLRAATCMIEDLAERGDKKAVAERLNYTDSGLRKAVGRFSDATVYDLLDPSREPSKNALSASDLLELEQAWEMFTEPAPDYTITLKIGDEYITKAVHYKKYAGWEVFEKANDLWVKTRERPLPCALAKFKECKPAWIWEPTYATCLCPYCFEMLSLIHI